MRNWAIRNPSHKIRIPVPLVFTFAGSAPCSIQYGFTRFLNHFSDRMRIRFAIFSFACLASPLFASAQPVTQPFTFSILSQDLPAVRQGSVSWGDIDGDGDLDVFVSGEIGSGIHSAFYRNEGMGSNGQAIFSLMQGDVKQVVYSFSAFGDFDGDGDLDLLVGGSRTLEFPYQASTTLYRNDAGSFVEMSSTGLPNLHSGSASWGDLDSDGDLDLIMTGVSSSDELTSVIAINDGGGSFTVNFDELIGVGYGDSDLGDIDGDQDLDLVISGASDNGFITMVLLNDNGTFTPVNAAFSGYAFSSVDFGDFDNDGDLDLVISGGEVSPLIFEGDAEIWQNSGGSFSLLDFEFEGILAGDVTWGDYDNDGDLDLLVIGAEEALGRRSARIFRNDGGGNFVNSSLLVGTIFGDADWGDFDGDGDLDLLVTGRTTFGSSITNLYENRRQVVPPLPPAPQGLVAEVTDERVQLSWLPPPGLTGANASVTYNVRVGRTVNGSEILSAMANKVTGRLLMAHAGNAASAETMMLDHLVNGTYFWSVQTINHAFMASAFSSEGTFSITGAHSVGTQEATLLPQQFAVYANYPNPFSQRTTIQFDLPEAANVEFRIFTLLGQEVANVSKGVLGAGQHHIDWDGHSRTGVQLGSGIYFYELRAGDRVKSGTMTLVR